MNRSIKDTVEHKEFWRIIDTDRHKACIAKRDDKVKKGGGGLNDL